MSNIKYPTYPKIIEFQLHNKCNSNCIICPYRDMHYNYEKMDSNLFEKLLNDLEPTKVTRLIPYLNNEPFLDKDYLLQLKKLRTVCPSTEIEISTNLSFINSEILSVIKNLDLTELRISIFGFAEPTYKKMMPNLNYNQTLNNLEKVYQSLGKTDTIISIVMIDDGTIEEYEFDGMKKLATKYGFNFERWGFLDRAQNVAYKSNNINNTRICGCDQNRPLERMHILANGNVIFCCQDWKHEYIIGNIKKNSIREIWNSEEYNKLRNLVYEENEQAPKICQHCKISTQCKGIVE